MELAVASFIYFMLYEELGELGPEFRLPDDVEHLPRPWLWESYHRPIPEVLPLHGLMVVREMENFEKAIYRSPSHENTLVNLQALSEYPSDSPVLEVGYITELFYPPAYEGEKNFPYDFQFCLSGFALPDIGLYQSVRGPHDSSCVHYGSFMEDPAQREKVLQEFKPLDQSSPWVRSMLRHMKKFMWDSTSIVSEDRMLDTSLDPPKASDFGEWWEEEWERARQEGGKKYVYHITYPSMMQKIRESGVLEPSEGYARVTWCPDAMVGNTFGASRFIRIPVEDIPEPGLINVTYDEDFVINHPEIAETIPDWGLTIDRTKLGSSGYVWQLVSEIERYSGECESVYPGALQLPPTTEWGVPAIGPMGLLFGE